MAGRSPSTTLVISTYHLLPTMPSSSRTIPGTQNQFGIGCATVRVRGQTSNRTNAGHAITPFMFNEEGYRVSASSQFLSHELTCFHSMLVTRTGLSTLPLTSSTVGPTPMTWIKTGSKISIVEISFTLSVAWLIVSWLVTNSIHISVLPFIAVSFITHWGQRGYYPGGKLKVF